MKKLAESILIALIPTVILWGCMAVLIHWELGHKDTDLFLVGGTSAVIIIGGTFSFWILPYQLWKESNKGKDK